MIKSSSLVFAMTVAMVCAGCAQQAALRQAGADSQAAQRKGDYKTAALDLNPIVDAYPENPQVYMAQAYDYLYAGENDQGIADISRAIELEPNAAEYRIFRSQAYTRTSRLDLALDDANEAIRLAPHTALCYSSRGFIYMAMGDSAKAIADLSHAIELDPNNVMFLVQRGFAYGMAGRYGETQADWQSAIKMRPDYGPAYSALGWLQATCPDAKYRDAKQALENAKRGAGLGAPTMLVAAVSGAAVKSDVKPAQNNSSLAWSLDALAAAYAEAGDFQQAVAVQQQAISHNKIAPNPLATKEQKLLALYQQQKPYRAGFDAVVPSLPWIVLPS
ncbi:MAG: tetratricopeptide repeat protein [Candidatus Binataceae bacterium]